METMKEAVANIGASAKSGLEKTKAVVGEKVEKMTAHDPLEKEMAEQRKHERIQQAELEKRNTMAQNASAGAGGGTHSYSLTGDTTDKPTGGKQMSTLPGRGTGEPTGNVVEGLVQSDPIGVSTGTNTHVGGGTNQGYGTGGGYA